MGKIYKHLAVSEDTFNKVMDDCVKEFVRNNPKFDGIYITHAFIVERMAKYYLGE